MIDDMDQLRRLNAKLRRKTIAREDYDAAFQRLKARGEQRCSDCGHPPAIVESGKRILCGYCAIREWHEVHRRSDA